MHQLDLEDVVASRRDMFPILLELLSPVQTRILMLEFCGFLGVDIHSVIWNIRPYIHRYNFIQLYVHMIQITWDTVAIGENFITLSFHISLFFFFLECILIFFSPLLVPAFTSFVPPTGHECLHTPLPTLAFLYFHIAFLLSCIFPTFSCWILLGDNLILLTTLSDQK